ncbi:hypothetical protein FB565_004393 [Actinoplanes lutulentus]|uniref:FXSXX-COOH protein n=1 Tax=Actinoplanes lutulentus TaxID=1287878 RepID=A0A327YZ72_9ACTN|nr:MULTISPECIES: hypothetical protein [Actinoplanes]MBB2944660.1 hypothetical protein [Actinoplanes lutulentus]RAK27133.1 hypothetical protein B0I29_12420 [Actinoplanes lutulentus]
MTVVHSDETRDATDWAATPDVSAEPVTPLDADDGTIVGRCADQVLRSLDDPDGVLSAFSSLTPPPNP